ncbi:DUF2513 domain-containing protein [Enterococcus raffinosus]|uniref:DUF2513 domain-containing protein n=1 Tax=Enterococcus raffinosus ATCC 49464 TaxID=1158602 RepID=R2R6D2_9ENTE|nr:DUF2513 domain-containing protein [Enterococcus raffinosus]EOH76211.1 hypothetical protein UAK_03060 [Enterococcus raffinosus ATCC 49464]EOT76178.1 hypothetical protein I590_03003 [Enterococcus raffinosus ATCC 49464]UXK02904.1 DUF2513 domain-containing protein [Enterococcus raffinosus]
MKLNQNCIRDILLELEDELGFDLHISKYDLDELKSYKKYGEDEFLYTISKLSEAGYINESHQAGGDTMYYQLMIHSITWEGHKFLDTIRDNQVWAVTKKVASKFSSVSVNMISTIASTVITNLIENQMRQSGLI